MTLITDNRNFKSTIKCPKCNVVGLFEIKVGSREKDIAYWCVKCEDQIAKDAVILL